MYYSILHDFETHILRVVRDESRRQRLQENSLKEGLSLFVYISLHTSQVAHQAEVYPRFCSMKRLGVFYSPLDGILVHRRVPTSIAYIHLGGERHCESKVSCLRTQISVPDQGSNPNCAIWRRVH